MSNEEEKLGQAQHMPQVFEHIKSMAAMVPLATIDYLRAIINV